MHGHNFYFNISVSLLLLHSRFNFSVAILSHTTRESAIAPHIPETCGSGLAIVRGVSTFGSLGPIPVVVGSRFRESSFGGICKLVHERSPRASSLASRGSGSGHPTAASHIETPDSTALAFDKIVEGPSPACVATRHRCFRGCFVPLWSGVTATQIRLIICYPWPF